MRYSYTTTPNLQSLAANALDAAGLTYSYSINGQGIIVDGGTLLQNDVDTIITNATGLYSSGILVSAPSGIGYNTPTKVGGFGASLMLALSGAWAWIKNLFSHLNPFTAITKWLKKIAASAGTSVKWIVALLVVALIVLVFVHGTGEGVGSRV